MPRLTSAGGDQRATTGTAPSNPAARRTRGEDGYNLVILTIMFTVLTIGLSAALPRWTAQIQREKEEELIFRGLQYAEAIRIFQIKNGRLPVRLEELIEVEPRTIRQLWTNPMREDGRWALIFQAAPGQGNRGVRPGQARPGQQQRQRGERGNEDGSNRSSGRPGSGDPEDHEAGVVLSASTDDDSFGGEVATGPIRGVYHPGDEDAFKTFFDSNTVAEWKFTFDLLQMPGGQQGNNQRGNRQGNRQNRNNQRRQGNAGLGAAGLPQRMPLNSNIIGRPFPPGIQPPNQGGVPGSVPVGGQPNQGIPQTGRPVGTPGDSAGGPGGAAVQGLSESGGSN